jgi:hypothetical protein
MTTSEPSRNIDELKRLVITALDKSGVLADLRSNVKLHVSRAINEDAHSPLVHPRNARINALMGTDRGQLLTELILEFLRFYDLKDTLSMLMVEAGLPRLRPSEVELSKQCGFSFQPTVGLSVLEQFLSRKPEAAEYAPHHSLGDSGFDIHAEAPTETSVNTSLDADMEKLRTISQQMEILSSQPEEESPRYEDDEFDQASAASSKDFEKSPMPLRKGNLTSVVDDDVLFESRESLRNLGETPATNHPIEKNDHIERLEKYST